MEKNFFELNLKALRERYADLAEKLESLPDSGKVRVVPTNSGEPTAIVEMDNGTAKRIHSGRDPRREVSRWATEQEVRPSQTLALFGVGLGYPVEELLRTYQQDLKGIWCFEASLEVFRAMLSFKDWRWLIEEPKVLFFVGVDENEFRASVAGRFQQAIVDGVEIVEYPPSVQLYPQWYRARQENLRDMMRQWSAEMMLVMKRGRLFLSNIMTNFRGLPRGKSYLLRDIGERFRGMPAILVSAGPSLNKNAAVLSEAKGKIPIIAVDTALRVLQRHGVCPDFVVSIDSLGMSRKHFEGVSGLEGIPLIYDLEGTPSVISEFPGPRYLVGNTKPVLYRWIEEITGPLEGLTKGLTVAQAAFLLLAHYGARPIILVGQDLSFEREGGGTHAEGVAFQGRFQPGKEGRGLWEDPLNPRGLEEIHILQVPANDGGTVPTTHTLYTYLKRFEDDIAATGSEVINATEGGARIRGTFIAPLRSTIRDLLPTLEPTQSGFGTPETTIGERYGEELEKMRAEMLGLLEYARSQCEEGFRKSDRLWADLGWKEIPEPEIDRMLAELSRHFARLRESKKTLMLIDQGVQRALYMLHKGDLPPPKERTSEHHRIVADRFRTFFADALDTISDGMKALS